MSRIDSVNTSEDKIANIIVKLNSKEVHGYDDISIAMLKLCAPAVSKPLNLIFKKCLSERVFLKAWKFANVQPIHKKVVGKLNLIIVLNIPPSYMREKFGKNCF